jgi:hypothetical protein
LLTTSFTYLQPVRICLCHSQQHDIVSNAYISQVYIDRVPVALILRCRCLHKSFQLMHTSLVTSVFCLYINIYVKKITSKPQTIWSSSPFRHSRDLLCLSDTLGLIEKHVCCVWHTKYVRWQGVWRRLTNFWRLSRPHSAASFAPCYNI